MSVDDIVFSQSVEGTMLTLTERETGAILCDRECRYDTELNTVHLPPGTYTVEFCWYGGGKCYVEDTVVP